ncbi:LysR substrate-binding domain-containing protein [Bosea sp. (in: a-proteobacteria)]|jgi:DNA-binding transcriptional LysR family regulator|uniref:LysR substrate-binding domain-containing protein n=1 Tax=Bosea sp. (in: a-proteobacteria) TaxID=1871050 RepID=UPI003F70B17A
MNLRQIEAFRMVMLTGTVTGAAERLSISQPAVSRLLSLLEAKTGLTLFTRSKQRLQPTPEALLFLREVDRSFVGLEKLERAAHNIRTAATGSLRIASIPIVGLVFLPRVIARYRRLHPDVAIGLQTRSSATVMDWMASSNWMATSNYDLGFASSGPEQSNIQKIAYAAIPGVCILPAGHRLAAKSSVEVGDLEGEEFISLDPADGNRVAVDKVFQAADVRRRMSIEAPYALAVANMVAAGAGVSVVSPLATLGFSEEALVVRPFAPVVRFGFSLLLRKDIPLSLAARAFLDITRAHLVELYGQDALVASV